MQGHAAYYVIAYNHIVEDLVHSKHMLVCKGFYMIMLHYNCYILHNILTIVFSKFSDASFIPVFWGKVYPKLAIKDDLFPVMHTSSITHCYSSAHYNIIIILSRYLFT